MVYTLDSIFGSWYNEINKMKRVGDEMKELKELRGSVKQVEWAKSIREKMANNFDYYKKNGLKRFYNTLFPLNTEITENEIVESYKELICSQEDSEWFIENRIKNIIELIVEKEDVKFVEKQLEELHIDIAIFEGAEKIRDFDFKAMRYMKTLNGEAEKQKFKEAYLTLDGKAKEIIFKKIKSE